MSKETFSGICDFCGEESDTLREFNQEPVAGACCCEACAKGTENGEEKV